MGREEHGGLGMDAAQLDTQRKKEEAILKTSSTTYSTNRSSSSTRPAKLQLDRAEKSKCMRTRSSRSTEDLVELDLQRVERGFRGHRGYKRNLRCLLLIQWMYQRGMETLWAMDSVELGKLDRLVKEMLQTATNRDKGLFHHQCRTTTLRSSWE
ncbi:unnamed protein product [Microthlaspi erraticum]|uniref:Uncharacterized protein n=1 Tax=Microthlaspi erraticum TaxID=1685480 RepID=A0A6D2KVI2_9BRAS|nr:unnamed protein product [Microthlaspi erraticum]